MYAQLPRRTELETSLDLFCNKYPNYLLCGDFKLQLTLLDSWSWLIALVHDRHFAVDVYRAKYITRAAYRRFRSALVPCDRGIDLILISTPPFATESFKLKVAEISHQDTFSDHHPVYCHFQLPSTPEQPPPRMPSTLFRRLTPEEEQQLCLNLEPLEWYAQSSPTQVPAHFLLNTLTPSAAKCHCPIIALLALLTATATPRYRNYSNPSWRTETALGKVQAMSDSWRSKISKTRQRKLHYAMVRCSKMKRAVHEF